MKNDFFKIYDMLISGICTDAKIDGTVADSHWSLVSAGEYCGIAMTTDGNTVPPMLPGSMKNISLREAAAASKSWNLSEASFGCAAVNAYYNTEERIKSLGAFRPFYAHYSDELDFSGKTVGVIGHLRETSKKAVEIAAHAYILERNPQPGDYPDSACDYILPMCDIVVITGSTLVNKTLPHLLELCPGAYKVLTGPSVPLCPELLDMGIDMLAGMTVSDVPGILKAIESDDSSSPYRYGIPFMIRR